MSRVVVSLSTIPPRFNDVKYTLDSLVSQNRVPDKIYLYIANHYTRFNITVKDTGIPTYLMEYGDILQIVRGPDYGPICKLFGALQFETDLDTIIVTCDDDLVYGDQWLETLEQHSHNNSGCAVGFRGRLLSKSSLKYGNTTCITSSGISKNTEVDIVTAVRGWAYTKSMFNDDYISVWEATNHQRPYIFYNDDIYISAQLELRNIPKIVVNTKNGRSSNMRLHDSSLIKSKGQGDKTNMHIEYFKHVWKPKGE